MGSDGALDAKDHFMKFLDLGGQYYFDLPVNEVRDALLALTLEEIKEKAESGCTNMNRFVVPYIFVEYGAYPEDPKIKAYLKDCLDYHVDFNHYGNGEEEKHVNLFRDNFEEIITGKKDLEKDPGLFSAIDDFIESGKSGLANLTRDDD